MRLVYNTVYDIADFNTQKVKSEYNKKYYAVFFLKNSYTRRSTGGFCTEWKVDYKRGYYVIPVKLEAHKWLSGDKIIMRVFFEDSYIRETFKPYFGVAYDFIDNRNGVGYEHYIEKSELYDDIDEAITRAKELDKLLSIDDKINNTFKKLVHHKKLLENLQNKMDYQDFQMSVHYRKKTKRQELEHELQIIAKENRTKLIEKLKFTYNKLNDKKKNYREFLT